MFSDHLFVRKVQNYCFETFQNEGKMLVQNLTDSRALSIFM